MSRSTHKAGVEIRLPIEVFNGTTPVKGLTIANFTVTLTKDGADVSTAGVDIDEVEPADATDPRYEVTVTLAVGCYRLRLAHATYGPRGWGATLDVTTDGIPTVAAIQSGLATAAGVSAVEADTQDIQSRLPAALVGGRMDASVGAMAAGVVTAAAVATGAIDADAVAADAANEIADAVLDRASAIDGKTPREAIRIIGAATAGAVEVSGSTVTHKGLDGTTTRITGTVDDDGQRSSVSYP